MSRHVSFAPGAARASRWTRVLLPLALLLLSPLASGCGDDDPPDTPDAGTQPADGGSIDGGAVDGGNCVPRTSCDPLAECGVQPNGCGGNVECGTTCVMPETCGGRGVANTCGIPAAQRQCSKSWCWEYPVPHGYALSGAHFRAPDDGWAVGEDGYIQHWDGSRWTPVASGTLTPLRGVHAASATDVWAVGTGGTVLRSTAGGAFAPVSSGTTRDLAAVWASEPSDVWVVGAAGTVRRNRGSGFQGVDVATTKALKGVWASGPSDVWMVGQSGTLRRYDGTTVSSIDAGTPVMDFHEVSGTGPNDVWTVASDDPCLICDDYGIVFRTTPTGIEQSMRSSDQLFHVYAASPSLVLTSGEGSRYAFDGTKWTATGSDTDSVIAGAGPLDTWAFGPGGRTQRWNGQAWGHHSPAGLVREARAIHGSGPSDIWVGGERRLLHWNGGGWLEHKLPEFSSDDVSGVFAVSPSLAWVTTSFFRRIHRWDGTKLVMEFASESRKLLSIHGASATDVWVVGEAGEAIHSDGTTWTRMPTGAAAALNAVWVQGASLAFAVGDSGTIMRWDGATWTPSDSGTAVSLKAVWGSGPSDVWAAGAGGTLLRFDGTRWNSVASGVTVTLHGLWGLSAKDVWATGEGGTLLHFDGTRWSAEDTGTRRVFRGVWGPSASELWLAGDSAVLHRP
jgi:hypothetical protein